MNDLLDEIDRQWGAGKVADLDGLLSKVPVEESDLRVELCAADLEWRWRRNTMPEPTIPGVAFLLPAKPKARDYRNLLAGQWNDLECQRNLLEAEWCARSLWGDSIDVDEFAAQLPNLKDWSVQLAKQLHEILPLDATLTQKTSGESLFVRVGPDFVIGRQRSGEPDAPAWVASTGRLIVANRDFRMLSREHFRVRRTKSLEVEITNLSKTIVRFEDHNLARGEVMRMDLPFWLDTGMVSLSIDRCADELD